MSNSETEAARHIVYLAKCRTDDERIEYISAVMRVYEARGVMRGGQEMADAVQKAQVQSTDRPIGAVYSFSDGGCHPVTK